MKPMLDKDFDAFFKSSFEDLEIAPATDSWTKISDEINPKRKKFPLFWMAAASIVIVLGIGIGLYTKPTDVIKLHPDGRNEMMGNLAHEQKSAIETAPEMNGKVVSLSENTSKNTNRIIRSIKENKSTTNSAFDAKNLVDEPIKTDLELVKNIKPVRAKLATERLLEQEEIDKLKTSTAINLSDNKNQVLAEINRANEPSSVGRTRISSVGDLVNFVVAKVDKRDEKLIVMSRTQESDNEITGINLGLFKFRKQD